MNGTAVVISQLYTNGFEFPVWLWHMLKQHTINISETLTLSKSFLSACHRMTSSSTLQRKRP